KEERITITALIPKITLDVISLVGFNYEFNSTTSGSELSEAYKTIVGQIRSPLYVALVSCLPFITDYNNKYFDSVKSNENLQADEQLTHNELIGQ
ncbi:32789_t:CDS:2, partial [Racocetra persica]